MLLAGTQRGQKCPKFKSESKVQTRNRGRSLQETQTGIYAWNDLAFVVTKKIECFVVGFIRVMEFSPESFEGVLTIVMNTVPQRIVFADPFDLFHKMRVFFP